MTYQYLLALGIMGIFGLSSICYVLDYTKYSLPNGCIFVALVCLGGVMLWLSVRCLDKWYKIRRNYIYNLVRQDERKRCMTKMERYEHEGSR